MERLAWVSARTGVESESAGRRRLGDPSDFAHSDVSVTQGCYIKTVSPESVAAMRRLAEDVASLEAAGSRVVSKNDVASMRRLQ